MAMLVGYVLWLLLLPWQSGGVLCEVQNIHSWAPPRKDLLTTDLQLSTSHYND